jgi:hypothetical protein
MTDAELAEAIRAYMQGSVQTPFAALIEEAARRLKAKA